MFHADRGAVKPHGEHAHHHRVRERGRHLRPDAKENQQKNRCRNPETNPPCRPLPLSGGYARFDKEKTRDQTPA